jgi:hypothetical protein
MKDFMKPKLLLVVLALVVVSVACTLVVVHLTQSTTGPVRESASFVVKIRNLQTGSNAGCVVNVVNGQQLCDPFVSNFRPTVGRQYTAALLWVPDGGGTTAAELVLLPV